MRNAIMPVTTALAVLLFALLVPSSLRAHRGDRLLVIQELTDEDLLVIDVHDGSIDDWLAVLGEATVTERAFTQPMNPSLALRMWLGWHGATSRIFVATQTVDDVYVNSYGEDENWRIIPDVGMVGNDGFLAVGVDGDHSGLDYYAFSVDNSLPRPGNMTAQVYHAIGGAQRGWPQLELLRSGAVPRPWATVPPFGDAGGIAFSEQPAVTITEAWFTAFDHLDREAESSLPSRLEPGRVIGLAMKVHDYDTDAFPWPTGKYDFPGYWGLEPEGTGYYAVLYENIFGDALLLPRDPASASAPEVPSLTWARIKAAIGAAAPAGTPR